MPFHAQDIDGSVWYLTPAYEMYQKAISSNAITIQIVLMLIDTVQYTISFD